MEDLLAGAASLPIHRAPNPERLAAAASVIKSAMRARAETTRAADEALARLAIIAKTAKAAENVAVTRAAGAALSAGVAIKAILEELEAAAKAPSHVAPSASSIAEMSALVKSMAEDARSKAEAAEARLAAAASVVRHVEELEARAHAARALEAATKLLAAVPETEKPKST